MIRINPRKTAAAVIDMHRFALDLMSRMVGWPMTNTEIAQALAA